MDDELQAQIDEMRKSFADHGRLRVVATRESAQLLQSIEEHEAKINSGEFEKYSEWASRPTVTLD